MTPAIASAHTAHSGKESISSGAKVIMAMRTIDRDRPITIALLRASIPVGVLVGSVAVERLEVSVLFIVSVSVGARSNSRMVLGTTKVTSHLQGLSGV